MGAKAHTPRPANAKPDPQKSTLSEQKKPKP